MIIKYQTFVNKHLLVIKFEGEFCIDRYKEHVLEIVQKPEWDSINKILLDLRLVEVNFDIEDVNTLVEIKRNVIKKEHLSVQLVDKPIITALTHLIQSEFINLNLTTEYCCTIEKAIELLNVDFKEEEVTKILDNLEYTF